VYHTQFNNLKFLQLCRQHTYAHTHTHTHTHIWPSCRAKCIQCLTASWDSSTCLGSNRPRRPCQTNCPDSVTLTESKPLEIEATLAPRPYHFCHEFVSKLRD